MATKAARGGRGGGDDGAVRGGRRGRGRGGGGDGSPGGRNGFGRSAAASSEEPRGRVASAPDDPSVAKYARMGYPRDAVVLGVAMWGDDQGRVVDFCEGFARVADMGFGPEIVAGALASCDNDVDRALGSLLR